MATLTSTASSLGRLVSQAGRRLLGLPYWAYAGLVWLVAFLKAGLGYTSPTISPLASFPYPDGPMSGMSYGLRIAGWLLHTESASAYLMISGTLILVSAAAISAAVRSQVPAGSRRAVLALIATGATGTILLGTLGRNDALLILGSVVAGLYARRPAWMLLAAVLMLLGNPEQALVAAVGLLTLSFHPRLGRLRAGAGLLVALIGVGWGLMALWATSRGVPGRGSYLVQFLGNSIYQYFSNLPLSIYASLGSLWIIVVYSLVHSSPKGRWLLVIPVLAVPTLITAVTLDQTRVFVGVSTAAVVATASEWTGNLLASLRRLGLRPPLAWLLVACLALPSLEITPFGTARIPFMWVFTDVIPWLQGLTA